MAEAVVTRHCAVCEVAFSFTPKTRGRYPKFCSQDCKSTSIKNYRKDAHHCAGIGRGKYERSYSKIICSHCGKAAQNRSNKSTKNKFCSKLCRQEFQNARRRKEGRPPRKRKARTCKHCATEFIPKKYDRIQFCSRDCGYAFRKANALPADELARRLSERRKSKAFLRVHSVWFKHCQHCGGLFTARTSKAKYCSDRCLMVGTSIRKGKSFDPRPCAECGETFVPVYGSMRRTYCSDECCLRSARRTARKARKAKQRKVTTEPVNPTKVFDRDGWRCQLCKTKTPRRLRGTYHPRAPELDHIIPLSQGGEHSYRNTQCACRHCNAGKGSKPLGQLRLIG